MLIRICHLSCTEKWTAKLKGNAHSFSGNWSLLRLSSRLKCNKQNLLSQHNKQRHCTGQYCTVGFESIRLISGFQLNGDSKPRFSLSQREARKGQLTDQLIISRRLLVDLSSFRPIKLQLNDWTFLLSLPININIWRLSREIDKLTYVLCVYE